MRWRKLQNTVLFHRFWPLDLWIQDLFMGMRGLAHPKRRRQQPQRAPAIVIGFLGGMVRHDDAVHSEVQIAADLRKNIRRSLCRDI